MQKSLIEIAYEFVAENKEPVNFVKIWAHVKEIAGLSEEEANKKAGQFFTNMMLDGRFVTLGENEWDLRSRHKFDKVHIDMKDVYSDVDTVDDDSEEEEEEKEYNQVFEERGPEDNDIQDDDSDEDEDKSDSEGSEF